jgi:hypothetical protein
MLRRVIFIQLALVVSLLAQQSVPAQQARSGFRIAGTVVSAIGGQNLTQVQVAIVDTKNPTFAETMVTGEDGRFQFENLAAGKYLLTGRRQGYSQQSFDEHFQYSTAIAVGPGLESENLVFRLRPDAAIAGFVLDDQNEAVRNADVMLFRQGTQAANPENLRVKDTSTNDRGHYLFGELPSGAYFVVVSAKPWYATPPAQRYRTQRSPDRQTRTEPIEPPDESGPLDVAYPITYYPGVTDASAATPLVLRPGDRIEADLSLAPVPAVHLRIYTGAETSAGIGANLTENVFGTTSVPVQSQSVPDGQGNVTITGVPPGDYAVDIHTYGKTPRSWAQNVHATENARIDSSQIPSQTPPINGVVAVDGQMAPTSAYVQLYNRAEHVNVGAQVSAKGEFRIDSPEIKSGDYEVYVYNVPRAAVTGLLASGATANKGIVTIRKGTPVELAITMSTALGEVDGVAELKGKPQAGAMILLVPDDPERNIESFRRDQSDSDGTFTLPMVVPGEYTVLAIANGWDLESNKAAVLQPYINLGEKLEVAPKGRYQVKLRIQ